MQITLIRFVGYREWTESLGFDREHIIQEVQGQLHEIVVKAFSNRGALAHPLRYDLMIAITNTVSVEDHLKILEEVQRYSPVPVLISIAVHDDVRKAEEIATRMLLSNLNSHQILTYGNIPDKSTLCIVHADLANSIQLLYDKSVYETYEYIMWLYRKFRILISRMRGIALYMGGDNMIGIVTPERLNDNINLLERFSKKYRVRIGIGISNIPREAMRKATEALDKLRLENKLEIAIRK